MKPPGHPRGQPLAALLAVLLGWTAGRAADWSPPSLAHGNAQPPASPAERGAAGVRWQIGPQSLPGPVYPAPVPIAVPLQLVGYAPAPRQPAYLRSAYRQIAAPEAFAIGPRELAGYRLAESDGGHPAETAKRVDAGPRQDLASAAARGTLPLPRRWSMDSWAMLRGGGIGPVGPGALPGSYGGSQSGAVIRYRLDRRSPYRLTAYVRSTSALGPVRDNALAAGLAARPVPAIPVVAALEGRMTDQAAGRQFQPAAMVYSELPPFRLAGGFMAETYVQAGYVGGRFATPFADGQVRADRAVLQLAGVSLRAGAGLWGGMQRGAARLDAGPGVQARFPLGRGMFGRVAADWRIRVAGDARPGSGPVLTLSAGF